MYKGPADDWKHKLGHWLVKVLTASKYSHCELFINGTCYSSSFRDGGVRSKVIDLNSGHWDNIKIEGYDEKYALQWFERNRGRPYDWPGMIKVCPLLRWLRFILPRRGQRRFCSEAVAGMLGYKNPETYSPQKVLRQYGRTPLHGSAAR